MHLHLKNSRGVGLVEIMVGMVVLGVIGLSLANLLRSQHHSFTNQNEGIRMTQNVRAGVEMLAEELQNAGLDPRAAANAGFSTIDAGDIAWSADLNGDGDNADLGDEPEQVRYYFSGDNEALYRDVDGTSTMVADGIQSFTFTYLDGKQDVTADPDEVEYVRIAVSYETPDGVAPGALETKVPIRNRILAMAGPGGNGNGGNNDDNECDDDGDGDDDCDDDDDGDDGDDIICVCHTKGGPDKTLCLPQPAIDAHLRHGDPEGPCPGDDEGKHKGAKGKKG